MFSFFLSDTIALYFYQYNIIILGLSYKVSTICGIINDHPRSPSSCTYTYKYGANFIRVWCTGHGLEMDGENFMVPVDSPAITLKEDARRFCLPLDFVLRSLDEHLDRESLIIVLLDCCRENPLLDVKSMRTKGRQNIPKGLAAVNLRTSPDSCSVFVGFAAAPGALQRCMLAANVPVSAASILHPSPPSLLLAVWPR